MKEYEVCMTVDFGVVKRVCAESKEEAEEKAYEWAYEKYANGWGFEVYYGNTTEIEK